MPQVIEKQSNIADIISPSFGLRKAEKFRGAARATGRLFCVDRLQFFIGGLGT
jgi:hypothetical protein